MRLKPIKFTVPGYSHEYFPDGEISVGNLISTKIHKTEKGEERGYLTGVVYLSPSDLSGVNLCYGVKPGDPCTLACIAHTGQLGLKSGKKAQLARSLYFIHYQDLFLSRLAQESAVLCAIAESEGYRPALRLNGSSDIPYETSKYSFMVEQLSKRFPELTLYDYTKLPGRCSDRHLERNRCKDYHLTFSWSGQNWSACEKALERGFNVAVPFADKLPESLQYKGFPVIDGDRDDLRFLDPTGVLVGLKLKRALKQNTGNGKGTWKANDLEGFCVTDHL